MSQLFPNFQNLSTTLPLFFLAPKNINKIWISAKKDTKLMKKVKVKMTQKYKNSMRIRQTVDIFKICSNYNNFQNMDDDTPEELTQYQKFRLLKLANRHDDDNFSAHFSNVSCNISTFAKSERDIRINSFRSSDENQEDFKIASHDQKILQFQDISQKYKQLESKYDELFKQYQAKQQEAQKYKKLYEGQLNRERETKKKLKNWVQEAKTNLNH